MHYQPQIRGYETYRHYRESRPKGGIVTLVRNNIPPIEVQRSRTDDTEFIGAELILPDHHLQVFNIYTLLRTNSSPSSPKINTGSLWGTSIAAHPAWGYEELDNKGEEVECWATNQLMLINHPDDLPTYYSRSWRTTSTLDLAFASDRLHKMCHREVCSLLGGSDHKPVVLHVEQHTQFASSFNRAPSWNYKKAD